MVALPAQAKDTDPRRFDVMRLKSGVVVPYPLDNVFRGFSACRRGRHKHKALDIGGVGPDWGIGTPVRSMARARVIGIRHPEDDPARFGNRIKRKGRVTRGKRSLPTSKKIPGYGKVYFFTSDHGSSRTGTMITTLGLEGRLKGHRIRYMHLGAVHPSLKQGSVVEAGQEIGLMGGTAVQVDAPHVHIDIMNRRGRYLDVGPLLGIGKTRVSCRRGKKAELARRQGYSRSAAKLMWKFNRKRAEVWQRKHPFAGCGVESHSDDFASGKFQRHRFPLHGDDAAIDGPWEITLTRTRGKRWQPKIVITDEHGNVQYSGASASKAPQRRYRFKRYKSGRKGATAKVALRPRKTGSRLFVEVRYWENKKRPPKNVGYELTISRPCQKGKTLVTRQR